MSLDTAFDDLDLREEPAGRDRGAAPAFSQVGCTQYTFACAGPIPTTTNACCF